MKHLGDITKISGYDAPIVDIICGGSPCQDLSIAGKRAGLDGERSGLFMEQVRIVKEMREKDEEGQRDRRTDKHIRPRFMVWENVPGAFTSPGKRNGEEHRGEDFQAVLTEIARIVKSNCPDVPLPKDRRWPHSGCIMGIGDNGQPFSIAYRLHDAQFWGVPQRRKRIALVADFGGCTAPNILFEKVSAVEQGLSRNIEQSEQTWKGTTKDTERSTRETSKTYDVRISSDGTKILENHPNDSRVKIKEDNIVQTLSSRMGTGGGNVPMVMEPFTSSKASFHQKFTNTGKADTLVATDYKDPQCIVYANEAYNYTVRRLTPLECERLQGFPDRWTDIGEWIDSKGKKHKDADSPRYKALGNSIALPFWQWMADRMVKVLKEDGAQLPTMASLFDGIGGFPLVYSRCGCKPIWASEIEEFPMAVTKIRFPEVNYESSNHNKRE